MHLQGISYTFLNLTFEKVANSRTSSFVSALCGRFSHDFKNSRTVSLLCAFVRLIEKKYSLSFLSAYINKESKLQNLYEKSFLCAVICMIFNSVSKSASFICNAVSGFNKNGYVHSALSSASERGILSFQAIFGLFTVVMIMCPHELWNNIYAVGAAIFFLLWFMIMYARRHVDFNPGKINFYAIVFVIFAVLSIFYAYATKDGARIVLFLLSALVLCFAAKYALNTEERIITFVKFLCSAVFVTSVMGIVQRIMGVEVDPEFVDIASNEGMPGRVFSVFANPNSFAELLILGIPFTLGLVYIAESKREKLLWMLFFSVDIVTLAMTYSRSCYVALVISIIFMTIVYDWKFLIPIGIIALFAVPLLPSTIIDRILTTGSMSDTSNSSRLYIWSGAWQVAKRYFLSGVGAGPINFAAYYKPFANHYYVSAPHSHMLYMELIIEFGIFGALSFFAYFVSVIKRGLSCVGHASKKMCAVSSAAMGSLVGMLFVFGVEYVWFYSRDMFVYWTVLGILGATNLIAGKNRGNMRLGQTEIRR